MPYDKDGVFSGCCVVRDGLPHILYTGAYPESVCLAIGDENGEFFTKSEGNPILDSGGRALKGWRDPYVLADGGGYLMLIGSGDANGAFVEACRSSDLVGWKREGEVLRASKFFCPDEMWECPAMAAEGADAALFLSAVPGFVPRVAHGAFDGRKFAWSSIGLADLGDCMYAPTLVKHPDGRWILFGWQRELGNEKDRIAQGWQGMLTLPREVEVGKGGVSIRPAKEVEKLRNSSIFHANRELIAGLHLGQHFELDADILVGEGSVLLTILEDRQGGAVRLAVNEGILSLDKGQFSGGGPAKLEVGIGKREELRLRAFVDGTSLEIYAEGLMPITSRVYPSETSGGFSCSARNEAIKRIDAYEMKSCFI
jgi:beta-fructofuranosidase